MKYPQILLLPAMMLADYYLTVIGAVLREKEHARHYLLENYELNPLWQSAIRKKKWLNLPHLALVALASTFVVYWLNSAEISEDMAQVIMGGVFSLLGMIMGRHLGNILLFTYLARRPGQISGQVTLSHQLSLVHSLCLCPFVLIPVALIAIFTRGPFAIGGTLGITLFSLMHLWWIWRDRVRRRRALSTGAHDPEPRSPINPQ